MSTLDVQTAVGIGAAPLQDPAAFLALMLCEHLQGQISAPENDDVISILGENIYLLDLNLKYVAFGSHLLSRPHVSG